MINNLCKTLLEKGARIKPLVLPLELSGGTGQMNPSVLVDGDKILVNIRCVQYVILHSENEQKFNSRWGPLAYMNPENDPHLRTTNFYMELDENLEPTRVDRVDTSMLDTEPIWEFVGLEDARLVKWDGKLFYCGVRRDTNPTGEGRMEMSEIVVMPGSVKEVRRDRIEPPSPSYCEKNWMPILDKPYHFIKWSNPTEVVEVNRDNLLSITTHLSANTWQGYPDFRGGSQVIRHGKYYYAITHEVILFKNELHQKDAYYYHRILAWDENFNLVGLSDYFDFMDARIEFCCGMAKKGDNILITFGYQDNAAYILEVPVKAWEEVIWTS